MTSHELTVLGYHLKQNLWLDETYDLVMLEDSVVAELDAAMMVRRDNQPGNPTPEGILTKMRGTLYERLIEDIEKRAEPAILELGFHLLSMNEDSCRNVHRGLQAITRKSTLEGVRKDFTLASGDNEAGICFHCNPAPSTEAIAVLETHCAKRKYRQRSDRWFGVSVSPSGHVQFGITLDYPWEASEEMDKLTADMKLGARAHDVLPQFAKAARRQRLPGHTNSISVVEYRIGKSGHFSQVF